MNLQQALDQVHDPAVSDARARIEARLEHAIGARAVAGDLDYERRPRWMLPEIVTRGAADDRDVGFGLGLVVQRDRKLNPHRPAGSEGGPQHVGGQLRGYSVRRTLRLSYDQATGVKLDGRVLVEHAELDQKVVLVTRPSARANDRLPDGPAQARTLATPSQQVNVPTRGVYTSGRLWGYPKR